MNFKKTLCGLVSAAILFGALGGTVGAVPMQKILEEEEFQANPNVVAHIVGLRKYMKEEKERLALEGGYFLENLQRLDSLVFGIFCCFCYKNNLTGYIDQVVRQRVPAERREDMDVIDHILPDNPEQAKKLYERFGMEDMPREKFAALARFIRARVPKRKLPRDGERRKPGRELRQEVQRGLWDHQSGYDADYSSRM